MDGADSSAALPSKKYNHDVFISFRGQDVRQGFVSHLVAALDEKCIVAFIDCGLYKADEISSAFFGAIKDSFVSLVVFSENYASSKWCLEQLSEILECKNQDGLIVIPVFYKVDPSYVRHLRGSYGEAFAKHESDFSEDKEMVQKWKAAVVEAANLSGWGSSTANYRVESELIECIVNDLLQILDQKFPIQMQNLVGIDKSCAEIESLLKEFSIVGIWGISGIGKTTIAEVVFAKLYSQFEGYYFFENVREEVKKYGLKYLCEKLLFELLRDENPNIIRGHRVVRGSSYQMMRLKRKKVLIVLDDVSDISQLECLTGLFECLSPDSRVLITTRDKDLLTKEADHIYYVEELCSEESLRLFSLYAFNKNFPEIGYEELSLRVLNYCPGIPLALKVLGSFLHSKTSEEWESVLRKLGKISYKSIQNVLKLSYDGLDEHDKQLFLDIACFLKGEYKGYVIRLLESCGYSSIGIRNLLDRALVTILEDNRVWMHDLIQQMGFEIVRQESIRISRTFTQLWDHEKVYGYPLMFPPSTSFPKLAKLHMSNCRSLKLWDVVQDKKVKLNRSRQLMHDLVQQMGFETVRQESIRISITYSRYPLMCLPSTSFPKLAEFHISPYCNLEFLDGVQDKKVKLNRSRQLMEIPRVFKVSNLGQIKMFYHAPPCTLSFHKLFNVYRYLYRKTKYLPNKTDNRSKVGCIPEDNNHLGSVANEFKFESSHHETEEDTFDFGSSFETMKVTDVSQLKALPPNLHSLRVVGCHLLESLIDELLNKSSNVSELYAIDCPSLKYLVDGGNFTSLRTVYIHNCRKLEFLLSSENFAFLEHLCMGSSCDSLKYFTLNHFPKLKTLCIWDFPNLESLSISKEFEYGDLPLESLEIRDCPSLVSFPIKGLPTPNLMSLTLSNCIALRSLPDHMASLKSLQTIFIDRCPELDSLPQGGLPSSLSLLSIASCDKLIPQREWELNRLHSLTCFEIESGCVGMESFPAKDLLPSNLNSLRISNLSSLSVLDYEGLQQLTALQSLDINCCPELSSIPDEGLPSSLASFSIEQSPLLTRNLKHKLGADWHKIAHVPNIRIDEDFISSNTEEVSFILRNGII